MKSVVDTDKTAEICKAIIANSVMSNLELEILQLVKCSFT